MLLYKNGPKHEFKIWPICNEMAALKRLLSLLNHVFTVIWNYFSYHDHGFKMWLIHDETTALKRFLSCLNCIFTAKSNVISALE